MLPVYSRDLRGICKNINIWIKEMKFTFAEIRLFENVAVKDRRASNSWKLKCHFFQMTYF